MQKVKPNLLLQFVAIPGFLIMDFVIGRYYPEWVLRLYPLHAVFILFLLFICLLPIARKPLAATREAIRFKFWSWLGLIWLFELSVLLVVAGLSKLFQLVQPELNLGSTVLSSEWILHWSLFPWGCMVSLACLFAYYAYYQNKDASLCTLMFPLFRSTPTQTLGITANMCARLNTVLAIISTFMLLALCLNYLAAQIFGLSLLAGLNVENILVLTIILVVMTHRRLGTRFFETLLKRDWSVFKVLCVAATLLVALLLFGATVFDKAPKHLTTLPQWLVQGAPLQTIAVLSIALYALSWSVVGGVFLAYISRGRRLIELVIAALIFPLLAYLISYFVGEISITVTMVLSALAALTLLYLLSRSTDMLLVLMQLYVPADEPKHRSQKNYVIKWIRMGTGLLYTYLIGGSLLFGLLAIVYALPSFIYFLLAVLASGFSLFKLALKKPKNKNS